MNQAELQTLVKYDPITGKFHWLKTRGNQKAGTEAGCLDNGYIRIKLKGKSYLAHQLAWLYMTGDWADADIDHKDTVRSNNAWHNLRKATKSQNAQNTKVRSDSKSGVKGVSWYPRYQKWMAHVRIEGKRMTLGYFDTIEEASAVVSAKRIELFGEFANHG